MIQRLGRFPQQHFYIAFSGGVDSVAVAHFLLQGGHNFSLAYFDHGTPHGKEAADFVKKFAEKYNLSYFVRRAEKELVIGESREAQWRDWRYEFLHGLKSPIVMCHHLNDQVENWVFTSLHGNPRLIPYRNHNVIRPFLITPKQEFSSYARRKGLSWVEDPSNKSMEFMRNRIRHRILPECYKVNAGLEKVIKKKVQAEFDADPKEQFLEKLRKLKRKEEEQLAGAAGSKSWVKKGDLIYPDDKIRYS